jgi:hypothetical protein
MIFFIIFKIVYGWLSFIHMTETGVSCGGRGYLLWLGVVAAGFCIKRLVKLLKSGFCPRTLKPDKIYLRLCLYTPIYAKNLQCRLSSPDRSLFHSGFGPPRSTTPLRQINPHQIRCAQLLTFTQNPPTHVDIELFKSKNKLSF